MKHGILIADASEAKIYLRDGIRGKIEILKELKNPQGRMRTQDLVSDEPGRMNSPRASGTRSAIDPKTTAHDAAAEQFAQKVAELIRSETGRGAFDSISLVAPPHFLGLLRPLVGKEVEQKLRATLARDLVHVPKEELPGHLDELLASPAAQSRK